MYTITISVEEFAKELSLDVCFAGRGNMVVNNSNVNRPGLQLAGYFMHFASDRVQLVGNAEMHYMLQLDPAVFQDRIEQFGSYEIPCIIFARGHRPPEIFLEHMKRRNIPVFIVDKTTTKVSHDVSIYLDHKLAPTIIRHGVLMDVYGVGVLLTGESGMGKSETALEMIKRGHQLVADDVMEIRRVGQDKLCGSAPELTRYLMEIRGIGIIDVRYMYGVGAVMKEKEIDMVMEMEMWQEDKAYERMGLDEEWTTILGVQVPKVLIPVRPGRNLAIVVEVAARNLRLKNLGYNAAMEFDRRWEAAASSQP